MAVACGTALRLLLNCLHAFIVTSMRGAFNLNHRLLCAVLLCCMLSMLACSGPAAWRCCITPP